MSFTPGPWKAVRVRIEDVNCNALAFTDVMNFEQDICIANANLIAAAPEMYEALKALLKKPYSAAALQGAVDALAKAEGRQS